MRKEQKREKLLQYAESVWNITEGTNDERIDLAINKTRKFFEGLGVSTSLSSCGIKKESIDDIVNALEKNGLTALSETGDLTLDISRKILEDAF